MRRKPGALTVLEQRVLDALGDDELHGYEITRRLGDVDRASVYKVLTRLSAGGRLSRRWNDDDTSGPRQRLYRRQRQGGEKG